MSTGVIILIIVVVIIAISILVGSLMYFNGMSFGDLINTIVKAFSH